MARRCGEADETLQTPLRLEPSHMAMDAHHAGVDVGQRCALVALACGGDAQLGRLSTMATPQCCGAAWGFDLAAVCLVWAWCVAALT